MISNRGIVEKIASSGLIWSGEMTTDIRSLFFKSLQAAKSSITISAFSMGNENSDVIEFFKSEGFNAAGMAAFDRKLNPSGKFEK